VLFRLCNESRCLGPLRASRESAPLLMCVESCKMTYSGRSISDTRRCFRHVTMVFACCGSSNNSRVASVQPTNVLCRSMLATLSYSNGLHAGHAPLRRHPAAASEVHTPAHPDRGKTAIRNPSLLAAARCVLARVVARAMAWFKAGNALDVPHGYEVLLFTSSWSSGQP
jgi:hypothetical protein